MIYFFHHYELPAILQQARIQKIIIETQQQSADSNGNSNGNNNDDATDGSGGSAAGDNNHSQNSNSSNNNSNNNNNNNSENASSRTGNDTNPDNNSSSTSNRDEPASAPNSNSASVSNAAVLASSNLKKLSDELNKSLNELAFDKRAQSFRLNLDIVLKKAIQSETNLNKKRTLFTLNLTEFIKLAKSERSRSPISHSQFGSNVAEIF